MRLQISRLQAGAIAQRAANLQLALYSRAFQCGQAPLSPTGQECALIGIVAALDRVEREGVAGAGNRKGTGEARAQIYVIGEASGANFNGALQLFVICWPAI